ncbi:hypothetical protein T4B_14148 [Trichinella pseudospiralis]|uniref:Uncharacterized protein n=1 Tax=Trichinella pseudospiralis TaxID=6337 RepID=A0A0V1DTQ5_TRIPS|nr:hypothetical protein T4A_1977 [Trichinella pseudospiralis]KRY99716.1 hypothetical protein T4B_14148 [Trichinella pseudospiralis]KRZ24809.1 hypothetical protein T4C_261 [Trichinella pseudospiralis]
MSFCWFQQDQSANRSAQNTYRSLDLSRPCQPITASEQLHYSSFSVVVSDQYHVPTRGCSCNFFHLPQELRDQRRSKCRRLLLNVPCEARLLRSGNAVKLWPMRKWARVRAFSSCPRCLAPLSLVARRSMDDRSPELLLRTTRCAIRQPTPVIGLTLPSKRFSLIAPDVPSTLRTRGHVS